MVTAGPVSQESDAPMRPRILCQNEKAKKLWGKIGAAVMGGMLAFSAAHAEDRLYRSYITPFPEGNRYRLVVLGDSLAGGLAGGLERILQKDGNIDIIRKHSPNAGLARRDASQIPGRLAALLGQERFHIAVVMMGVNDGNAVRIGRRWVRVSDDTPQWREAYQKRVDRYIKELKRRNIAIYWVGLPIMRASGLNQAMQLLTEVYREKAYLNGVKFIDSWNSFTDQYGRFSAYGPDLEGRITKLRLNDGIHLTRAGNEKLAHFVAQEIRQDLLRAKAERNIPLAGDEEEQRRAIYRRRASTPQKTEQTGTDTASSKTEKDALAKQNQGKRPKSENSPANFASRVTARGLLFGEIIATDLDDGLTALASISPVNETGNALFRLPLVKRPYYRVLVRGEKLPPKAGRADAFAWRQ